RGVPFSRNSLSGGSYDGMYVAERFSYEIVGEFLMVEECDPHPVAVVAPQSAYGLNVQPWRLGELDLVDAGAMSGKLPDLLCGEGLWPAPQLVDQRFTFRPPPFEVALDAKGHLAARVAHSASNRVRYASLEQSTRILGQNERTPVR